MSISSLFHPLIRPRPMLRAFKSIAGGQRLYAPIIAVGACLSLLTAAQSQTQVPLQTPAQTPLGVTPTPLPTLKPTPKPVPTPLPSQSTAQYRTKLQTAVQNVEKVERAGPRNMTKILKPLDKANMVKRDDGQTQRAEGDYWNQKLIKDPSYDPTKLTRPQSNVIKKSLKNHIDALDDWTTKRDGAYYTNLNAKQWVDQLKANGEIRITPPAWEKWITNVLESMGQAVTSFFRWLSSITPSAPSVRGPSVDPSWLTNLFYVLVAGFISFLLFLAIRSLQGKGFTFWRRARKSEEEMAGEDAELFQLPPDELMDRASRYASQGNFREALRHRFISLLVFLDGRGIWRYDVRRTNWEHIAQLRRSTRGQELVNPLSDLTRRFDRVRYGGAACDMENWQQFKQDADQLEVLAGGRGANKAAKREVASV